MNQFFKALFGTPKHQLTTAVVCIAICVVINPLVVATIATILIVMGITDFVLKNAFPHSFKKR